jgi:gliding motility-associated-like protein
MRKLVAVFVFVFYSCLSFATHNRAGEITYKHLSGLTYEFTIVTYTRTSSPADRPELELLWGDGTSTIIPRNEKINYGNDISRNTYISNHTFPGPSTYIISLEDPNRNEGVMNIPNSVNVVFYIETVLVINPFLGPNSSPVLLNPPIDNACVNQPFIHNPAAYDADGDSLSYRLVNCKGEEGLDIPGYTFPSASNSISINAYTGDLFWDFPIYTGEYNVAFLIEEWRHGTLIGSVERDMQIDVASCNNNPPVIKEIKDTCVLEGTLLTIPVIATDIDGDVISLAASGGPFNEASSPAGFQSSPATGTVNGTFIWQTECSHVQKQPYLVIFKATDNGSPVKLVDIESVQITVVAPAPPNLTASPIGNNIFLRWDKSPCISAIGYKIYRRNGFYGFVPGPCETGVPSYTGYVYIGEVNDVNDTNFTDTNNGLGLIHGIDYCYMVIAFFDDGAESYASNEACTTLIKDIPVITNVSIKNTDIVNGAVYVAWSKPTELDTIEIPGPYKYLVWRANNLNGTNLTLIDSLNTLNDTTYNDILLNTKDFPYSYRIDLYNVTPGDRYFVGSTQVASSVFITTVSSDNQIHIMWTPNVPWVNDTFVVYRQNDLTLLFDSIGLSTINQYTDTGLVNGKNYCYKVKSSGSYFSPGFIDPIINFSQITCDTPIDHTPSCPPVLSVIPDCEKIENLLLWTNPNNSCANDVLSFNVYYGQGAQSLELLTTINNPTDTFFLHSGLNTIAACYAVTAIDSFNNESSFSNIVCLDIDSCHIYELPNVFTPDGDGHNDYFIPFPYNFVEKIDLHIFNRWGKEVFHTEDPDINWNGKNINSNVDSSEGVYYYICDVYELKLGGLKMRTLTGFLHLLRD